MNAIFPKPAVLQLGKEIGSVREISLQGNPKYWPHFLDLKGDSNGKFVLKLFVEEAPDRFHSYQRYLVEEEGYLIEIKQHTEHIAIGWVSAQSKRGYHYAATTLKQLVSGNRINECLILDNPCMKLRGWIEGYYGKPWTNEERKRAFQMMSEQKMNTYVYAPKQDRFHRRDWAHPYPGEEQKKLTELIEVCHSLYLNFVFSVSPGLSIQYGSREHLSLLINKFNFLYSQGVRCFGLFFDDIPMDLFHACDQEKFKRLEKAHIYFILSVYEQLKNLDPSNLLFICPTQYFGMGNESYILSLCRALPKEIYIFWTGKRICSPEIGEGDSRYFYEQTGHLPLYWDNYPVNDANMRDEMHIGPFIQRSTSLHNYANGLIANVMEYPEASLIPLTTIAHYIWNPPGYHAKDSYAFAIQKVVDAAHTQAVLSISDCINQSALSPLPGNDFMMQWFDYQRFWRKDLSSKEKFKELITGYQEEAKSLLTMPNKKLAQELTPWIQQLIKDLGLLEAILRVTLLRDTKEKQQELERMKKSMEEMYQNKAKALGFFPYMIGCEIIEQEQK